MSCVTSCARYVVLGMPITIGWSGTRATRYLPRSLCKAAVHPTISTSISIPCDL